MRAISETVGEPVDFCTTQEYGSIIPLIQAQPYIREAWADPDWHVLEEAPVGPAEPPRTPVEYDQVHHLSHRGWPSGPTLAESYWKTAAGMVEGLKGLDLERAWITTPSFPGMPGRVAVGFGDLWFELKYGLYQLIAPQLGWDFTICCGLGSRWNTEGHFFPQSWAETAYWISQSSLFLGCLSAPWVLANALGKPTVIMEPAEPRWNSIFWLDHPRNTMVRGHDGRPSFHAPHVIDALRQKLSEVQNG